MQVEDDSQNINDLEKEVIELATETNVLKKSAPEANDESNIQYFLAIAELGNLLTQNFTTRCYFPKSALPWKSICPFADCIYKKALFRGYKIT